MLPKSYLIYKWSVYGLATVLLFALQHLLLNHIQIWGVTPFLYPMLPAVLASYEGLRRGSVFGLVLGAVCDILIAGPFDGFYTVTFTVIALVSALIGEKLLSSDILCALTVSSLSLVATGLLHTLVLLLAGHNYPLLMLRITLLEMILSLPSLVVIAPLYRLIYRRCAADY